MANMKPSEFAKKIGVSVKTLQRWDIDGVLKAHRNPKDRRYYTDEQYDEYVLQSSFLDGKQMSRAINEFMKEGDIMQNDISDRYGYEYFKNLQTKHRAFLINPKYGVNNLFVWDNDEYDFVSGELFSFHSGIRFEDIDIKELIKNENVYGDLLSDSELIYKQYVKHDGDTHIWIPSQESWSESSKYYDIYFGSVDYFDMIRPALFVKILAEHIHQYNKLIMLDNKELKPLKRVVFGDEQYNILIIKATGEHELIII